MADRTDTEEPVKELVNRLLPQIEAIKYTLLDALDGQPERKSEQPPQDQIASMNQSLIRERLDPDDVDIEPGRRGPIVRTTHYLETETWRAINRVMKERGLKWISDGKNSRWEVPEGV